MNEADESMVKERQHVSSERKQTRILLLLTNCSNVKVTQPIEFNGNFLFECKMKL